MWSNKGREGEEELSYIMLAIPGGPYNKMPRTCFIPEMREQTTWSRRLHLLVSHKVQPHTPSFSIISGGNTRDANALLKMSENSCTKKKEVH